MATDTLPERLRTMQAEATEKWRSWAHQIADGGELPSPLDVLEAGALLQISEPMQALHDAADAIKKVRDLESRADAERAAIDATFRPYGGEPGVRDRIVELEGELRKLRALLGPWTYQGVGFALGEASRLRQRFKLVFPSDPPKPRKPAPRRRADA